jgi:hypothetical protein
MANTKPSHTLSAEEQKACVALLVEGKKKFAKIYKKWLDTSASVRNNVDPKLCMRGM